MDRKNKNHASNAYKLDDLNMVKPTDRKSTMKKTDLGSGHLHMTDQA